MVGLFWSFHLLTIFLLFTNEKKVRYNKKAIFLIVASLLRTDAQLFYATEESHISIMSCWVVPALLSSCSRHTQSYIGVTGMGKEGKVGDKALS